MPWYDERHALRRLKSEVRIPIAAGETEYTPFGLRTMVAEGLVDYLIIDSTWAGGLTTWRKAAVMTELYQVPLAAHHDPQIHVHAVAASPTGFILESFADPTRDPLWFELFAERPHDRRRLHDGAGHAGPRPRAAPATRSRSTASSCSSRHAPVTSVSGRSCHSAASSASTRARIL